MYNARYL